MKRIAILGGGTAGTMMANRLRKVLEPHWEIVVLDQDQRHIYQPGLLFVPFGSYQPEDLVRNRERQFNEGIQLILSKIDRVDIDTDRIVFEDGSELTYDIVIVATGTRIAPEATPGMLGTHWHKTVFDFYTYEGSVALAEALSRFKGGRLVINVADMPIKCPVAPLEFAFLADAYFTERGIRDAVQIIYATPLDGAFTKPTASHLLGNLLEHRKIEVVPNFVLQEVDGAAQEIVSYDNQKVPYDLLVTIPLHQGADLIKRSGLGDAMGFIPTDKHTLQCKGKPNVFALGDATDLPTSKAGSVAHFQAEVLTKNLLAFIHGRPLHEEFDGHANCFIETGFGKAMLLDFNYTTEPLPGRFPLPVLGPFTLLEESHVNHWGKLGFRWVYWNTLLQGEDLPMDHRMVMAGKWRSTDAE